MRTVTHKFSEKSFFKGMWVLNELTHAAARLMSNVSENNFVRVSGYGFSIDVSNLKPLVVLPSRLAAFGFQKFKDDDSIMYHEPVDEKDYYGEYDFNSGYLILHGIHGNIDLPVLFIDQLQVALKAIGEEEKAYVSSLNSDVKIINRKSPVYVSDTVE